MTEDFKKAEFKDKALALLFNNYNQFITRIDNLYAVQYGFDQDRDIGNGTLQEQNDRVNRYQSPAIDKDRNLQLQQYNHLLLRQLDDSKALYAKPARLLQTIEYSSSYVNDKPRLDLSMQVKLGKEHITIALISLDTEDNVETIIKGYPEENDDSNLLFKKEKLYGAGKVVKEFSKIDDFMPIDQAIDEVNRSKYLNKLETTSDFLSRAHNRGTESIASIFNHYKELQAMLNKIDKVKKQ